MSVALETDLRATAERGAEELGPDATAQQLLTWAAETFGDRLIVASNMQDATLVDLAYRAKPDVRILFLETGYHFAETIGTRDAVDSVYPELTIVNAQAERSVAEQDAEFGKDLFAREPDRCCAMRKVAPLQDTLSRYDAWVTGVRRVEAPTRANTPLITYDDKFGLVKINPIAAWSDEDMDRYVAEHGVLVNPLVDAGYPSIGCAPCTVKPKPGEDPRSGRWAGRTKTECGLHA
ncbi:Phosphoadenylyl-sulfate reductase [thioredoxin] / Adenylyl-sulfate reductase [thioredoxin] [Pseudonocardia sp. Ae168_Ps1]|uniref:phosphoadenylyl-sulfate reductase n=1 Tax=unclassified Pseudonocardia TaxID=2619320 RepID=UPI00094AB1A9|nr:MULTISPECIES: phosphoadenylyl-sulfate reductase [unclassified Pseudonocardia]OLL73162.1 Phosphoadenylyl-sulfate reductase [thioredoxin] / Adenylyl-sulfate reductase [thioredoxin] [Pseudonocardia sp. Ae150A_Ps1]OLL79139.1 Phosphoadenylyl-sulfate reductase [thioredoxin] / Adenylyl-sulfate reductase [thioredoxin] [Pseudonocardia sp. Ae168_Ps1]OLL86724.1 Phosphoadenylyl-sulfate reductase [thioredoxin] / Adenylyl-sulfate reductase [thioredoxin] [Pseudonocardia sp. Ae263_Ps1]OLL93231.1 Phosphoaden